MRTIIIATGISISLFAGPLETPPGPAETVTIHGGHVSFSVSTSTLGIDVQGKSDDLEGRVAMHRAADGVILDRVTASLPVKSLHTGIGLRDSHMRKWV